MKKLVVLLILSMVTMVSFGQLTVAYHQSALPYAEVAYELDGKLVPSARLGMNTEFEDLVLELAGLYQFTNKENYEIYAGGGIRFGGGVSTNDGLFLVFPVGLNIFPFESKGFGFHMEAAPMFGDDAILRGSFGIRYRFNKTE